MEEAQDHLQEFKELSSFACHNPVTLGRGDAAEGPEDSGITSSQRSKGLHYIGLFIASDRNLT